MIHVICVNCGIVSPETEWDGGGLTLCKKEKVRVCELSTTFFFRPVQKYCSK